MKDRTQATGIARPAGPAPLPLDEIAGPTGLHVVERMLDGRLPLPPCGAAMDITPVGVAAGQIVS